MLEELVKYLKDKTTYGCLDIYYNKIQIEDITIRFVTKDPIPTIEIRFKCVDNKNIIENWQITEDDIQQIIYEPAHPDRYVYYPYLIIKLHDKFSISLLLPRR